MPVPPYRAEVTLLQSGIAPILAGEWENVTNFDTSVDPMVFDNSEGTIREWPKADYILKIFDSNDDLVEDSGDSTDPGAILRVPETVFDKVSAVVKILTNQGSGLNFLNDAGVYSSPVSLFPKSNNLEDNTTRTSTNNGGFDIYNTFVTPVLPSGTYYIFVPFTCRGNVPAQDITYRLQADPNGGGLNIIDTDMVEEPKDGGGNQRLKRFLAGTVVVPSPQAVTIQLEFGTVGGFITNFCYGAKVFSFGVKPA